MAGPEKDEDYNSASDEDFNPDHTTANRGESDSESSSADEAALNTSSSKKRKQPATAKVDDLDWDSGDEATVRKAKNKKRESVDEADGGGEAGLIKTRAQRRAEVTEKQPLPSVESTLDVDAIWAQMSATATNDESTTTTNPESYSRGNGEKIRASPVDAQGLDGSGKPATSNGTTEEEHKIILGADTVTIKRTYEFAGQMMTEKKVVAANSAEARLHAEQLSSKQSSSISPAVSNHAPLRRPKKRTVLGPPAGDAPKSAKLNTLEKSRLDWAGYVDQEGVADELDEHNRAKDTYLGRMDFLGRLDAKRDDELRSIKRP